MSNDKNTTNIDELTDGVSEAALLTAMQTLEMTVESIVQSSDRTMMLLTHGLPDLWTAVVVMLKATHGSSKMVSVEASEVEPEQVQMVMEGRRKCAIRHNGSAEITKATPKDGLYGLRLEMIC